MFTSVRFRNFKSLRDYTVHLKRTNILVGPNNAGKSSILDAFRVLGAAQTFAMRRNPTPLTIGRDTISGYEIPQSQLPISLENIHTDYHSEHETSVTFQIENGNKLQLLFFENSRCVLVADNLGRQIQNTSSYKRNYPLTISIFPTLGPLEEEESPVDPDYLRRWQSTRRSNRLFRNIWYQNRSNFDQFKSLVEETWPGMTISPPERHGFTRFFEGRTRRDPSTVFNEAIEYLDAKWTSTSSKLTVVPGKQLLSSLNTHLQEAMGVSITPTQIVRSLSLPNDCDLRRILAALDEFAATHQS